MENYSAVANKLDVDSKQLGTSNRQTVTADQMGSISGGLNSLALTEARNVAEDEDILKPEDV